MFKRAASDLLIDLLKYRKDGKKDADGDYLTDFLGLLVDCLDSVTP